jgi:hypothetical protein
MSYPARKLIYHNLILLSVITFAFFWSYGALKDSTIQLISLLTLIYIGFQILTKKTRLNYKAEIDLTLLTLIVFLIVFYTGGLESQLFFLIYFLLFGISMLFEPITSLTLALISSLFLALGVEDLWSNMFLFGSLFLITPLAIFFGTQYVELLRSNRKVSVLEHKGKALEEEVEQQERVVSHWAREDLSHDIEKIWEGLDKLSISKSVSDIEKDAISNIKNHLNHLLSEARSMEKKIEE